MRKIALVTVGLVAAVSLTACGTTPGGQRVESCQIDGATAAGCPVTIDYNGSPLNCITWDGSHGETGLTCDFVEYHGLHIQESVR